MPAASAGSLHRRFPGFRYELCCWATNFDLTSSSKTKSYQADQRSNHALNIRRRSCWRRSSFDTVRNALSTGCVVRENQEESDSRGWSGTCVAEPDAVPCNIPNPVNHGNTGTASERWRRRRASRDSAPKAPTLRCLSFPGQRSATDEHTGNAAPQRRRSTTSTQPRRVMEVLRHANDTLDAHPHRRRALETNGRLYLAAKRPAKAGSHRQGEGSPARNS